MRAKVVMFGGVYWIEIETPSGELASLADQFDTETEADDAIGYYGFIHT